VYFIAGFKPWAGVFRYGAYVRTVKTDITFISQEKEKAHPFSGMGYFC